MGNKRSFCFFDFKEDVKKIHSDLKGCHILAWDFNSFIRNLFKKKLEEKINKYKEEYIIKVNRLKELN